jgi:hypothetical protein
LEFADLDALAAAAEAGHDLGATQGFAGLGEVVGEAAQGGGGDQVVELRPAARVAALDVAVGVQLVEPDDLARPVAAFDQVNPEGIVDQQPSLMRHVGRDPGLRLEEGLSWSTVRTITTAPARQTAVRMRPRASRSGVRQPPWAVAAGDAYLL